MSSLPEPTGERRGVLPPGRRESGPPPTASSQRVSVDEMLTQLRNPEGVKRRRRTEQPVYKQRRKRRLLIGIVGGVTGLLVLGWFGFSWVQRYRLEGETFREGVNRRISDALNCDVDFTRIHDGGAGSLAAKEATLVTRGGDLIESGKFSGVSAALTNRSWISNEWGITSLSFANATLKLNPNALPASGTGQTDSGWAGGSDESRLTISPEPRIITLDAIRVVNGLDIEWPDPAGKSPESIRKLVGGPKIRPGGVMEGAFINGVMELRGLPPLNLDQVTWRLTGRHLDIPGGRIGNAAGARMEISGSGDLVPDGVVNLKINIVDTQLRTLFPAIWHERISGALSAQDCVFRSTFGKGPERLFSGDFTVKGALLTEMGFVKKVLYFLGRDSAALEFPELKGHFEWSPSGGLVLTNLSAERDSNLRLAGELTVKNGDEMQGRLKVSVTEKLLTERSEKTAHSFRPSEEGWLAMEFGVSGGKPSVNDDIRMGEEAKRLNFAEPVAPNGGVQPTPPPPAPRPGDREAEAERQFKELIQPK